MERIVDFFAPVSLTDALAKFLVFEAMIGPFNILIYHGVLGAPIDTVNLTIAAGLIVSAPFIVLALAMLAHLRNLRTRLSQLAATDMLTGLPNRRAFLDRIAQDTALREDGTFLMIDLDHFKQINDRHGHQVGDLCLQAAAAFINESASDIVVVGRLGGEEFGLFVPGVSDPADPMAQGLAGQLAAGLLVPIEIAEPVRLTMSVGLATAQGGSRVTDVMSRADLALYMAKSAGRARAVTWRPEPEPPTLAAG